MNELLNVNFDTQTVSARELHEQLHIKTAFKDWFPRMCEYGFEEGKDFCSKLSETSEKGGRPSKDADISVDMAKQICMIQRTPEGKQCRQYLLDLEKAWNTPEQVMARALKIADRQIKELKNSKLLLEQKIEEDKPKTIFADAVSASHTSILIGDLAKLICQNGYRIGQKRLFRWMRDNGYLIKRKGADWNMPTQRSIEMGLFEIKESTHINGNGCNVTTRTPKATGKAQIYFINKFLSETEGESDGRD